MDAQAKICFITSGRMDFGLMQPILKEIRDNPGNLDLQIIALGSHVSEAFGKTQDFILQSGFEITQSLETLSEYDDDLGTAKSFAMTADKIADAFEALRPDAIVLAGDRYELLACAGVATVMRIPIIHLYGGDVSYGAYDESIRHAITKLSHLHFTTNEDARRRVLQLGENPETVFNFGAPSLAVLDEIKYLSRQELENDLGITFGVYNFLITYHPVTRARRSSVEQLEEFLAALAELPEDHRFFITLPNPDNEGLQMGMVLQKFCEKRSNAYAFKALGSQKYLSLMAQATAVLGNSSSGLYETPSFKIPTVNIGDRQKGRLAADSVIHCKEDKASILAAIEKARDMTCSDIKNPYHRADTAKNISQKIKSLMPINELLEKQFYST